MNTFLTAGAVAGILWAILALVAGGIQYRKWDREVPNSEALDHGYRVHLRRNIIILIVSILWLLFGSGWVFAQDEPPVTISEPGPERKPQHVSLPQRCAVHLRPRSEDEWDPVREEYWPPNHEWEECMGVGRL